MVNEWISVKDVLPVSHLEEYLTIVDNEMALCCYNTHTKEWTYNCTCNLHHDNCQCYDKWPKNRRKVRRNVDVTHWMPLPSAPEREGE